MNRWSSFRFSAVALLALLLSPFSAFAATITSAASGAWATGGTWVGGVAPADGDAVVIAAEHAVQMNADLSAYTGLLSVTITGHATTPGMLYWKDGASGTLKIRTGYNLVGTTVTNRGRLAANSDGAWATTTALSYATKAKIVLVGTAKIDALNLDINLRCAEPTNKYVTTYKTKYDFTASAGTVNTTTGAIDIGTTPPTANTPIKIRSLGGTLPAGLSADAIYYVYGISGNTCKLALQSNIAATVMIPTDVGSGALTLFIGHTDTATGAMAVFEDVTADSWTTGDRVVLVDIAPEAYDQQRTTATITSATVLTLAANVDSVQYPGARIWLSARNVSIESNGTTAAQPIIDWGASTFSGSYVGAEIVNTGGTGTTFYGYGVNAGVGHTVGPISGCSAGVNLGTSHTISNVFGCYYGVYRGTSHTISNISGCVDGVYGGGGGTSHTISNVMGCTSGVNGGNSFAISNVNGCQFGVKDAVSCAASNISGGSSGVQGGAYDTVSNVSGCSNGVYQVYSARVSGSIKGCATGINLGYAFIASGTTFANNATDVNHAAATMGNAPPSRSFRHGGVASDTRAWSSGGTLTHTTTAGEYPTGKSYGSKFTHTSASYPTIMEWEITRPHPAAVSLIVHAKHDGTGLAEGERIHWEIVDLASDPFAGGTAVGSWIAADSADWQSHTLEYTTDDRPLILRAYCTRGSGDSYIYVEPQAGGAGGGRPEFRGGNF